MIYASVELLSGGRGIAMSIDVYDICLGDDGWVVYQGNCRLGTWDYLENAIEYCVRGCE